MHDTVGGDIVAAADGGATYFRYVVTIAREEEGVAVHGSHALVEPPGVVGDAGTAQIAWGTQFLKSLVL